jgi:hypothetical protein
MNIGHILGQYISIPVYKPNSDYYLLYYLTCPFGVQQKRGRGAGHTENWVNPDGPRKYATY